MQSVYLSGQSVSIAVDGDTQEVIWSDKLGLRRRRPYLIFVKDGEAAPFTGADIPGVCQVIDTCERQDKNREHFVDYHLRVFRDVRLFAGRQDFVTANVIGDVQSWEEACAIFAHASLASLRQAVDFFSPGEVEEMDEMDYKYLARLMSPGQ